jgi:hypothetical protein
MRRFFRFSVRDLLWLTLVVAVGLGWLVHEWQLQREIGKARGQVLGLSIILINEGYDVKRTGPTSVEVTNKLSSWSIGFGPDTNRVKR